MKHIPYVYLIKNRTTGLKYLGVRYAKGCHPSDLWVTYFTSSSLVGRLIDQFGKEDWDVKIIHQYPNDPEAAVLREAAYFPLIKKRSNYLNLTYSSGCQDLRIASKGGKVGGALVFERKIGIFRDYEERRIWCSMGGKVGGKVQAEKGLGFHQYKNNPELHRKWSSEGGKKGCLLNGWKDSSQQRERGKRGGLKNKGFKWYNDGSKEFKYTLKMQTKIPFDEFILETQYKVGRLPHAKDKKNY